MSETLEERMRSRAKESSDMLASVYPGDVVELLDARDARIKELDELLEQAKTILTEKNAKILDLQRNKGIDEMQERIKKLEEVKEWAFLVGGGSVYQEIFERVCFCSGCRCTENGNFDSGKHATGCDELNQRIQAVLEKGEA